jgi:DNA topoisomerase VI subunit A
MDDIETYELGGVTEKLKDLDKKRIEEELKLPLVPEQEMAKAAEQVQKDGREDRAAGACQQIA